MGFLRNFVVTYNYPNGVIQMSLNPNAPAGTSIKAVEPAKNISSENLIYVIIFIVCLVLVIILFICCCRARCKKQEETHAMAIVYD